MGQEPFILSLDVGTSSTRSLLFDATGTTVPDVGAQLSYKLTTSNDGEVSVDRLLIQSSRPLMRRSRRRAHWLHALGQ